MKWFVKMIVNERNVIDQEMHPSWCKEEARLLAKAIENFLKEKKPLPIESRVRVGQRY